MSNIIDSIKLSGTVYTIQGSGGGDGNPTVELTQAEYDALVSAGTVSADTYYIITDAQAGDLTQYWTSAQTQSAINQATSGKVNTSSVVSAVTSASTDNEIPTAKAVYDAIPTGGTSGGKAISAGTNISVTTGDTADTVSCKIPYSDVIYTATDIFLGKEMPDASTYDRVLLGKRIQSRANDSFRYSIGIGVPPSTNSSDYNELYGRCSIGIGGFKIGNGSQYSNLANGCVAIGYGAKTRNSEAVAIGYNTEASGTTKTNINNQLTIDTSNQVYISNSANTSTYCVQEKIETTEAALGGLKLVKLTQSAYDALTTKDANTIYYIVN